MKPELTIEVMPGGHAMRPQTTAATIYVRVGDIRKALGVVWHRPESKEIRFTISDDLDDLQATFTNVSLIDLTATHA